MEKNTERLRGIPYFWTFDGQPQLILFVRISTSPYLCAIEEGKRAGERADRTPDIEIQKRSSAGHDGQNITVIHRQQMANE
jgi:hypothetical protein